MNVDVLAELQRRERATQPIINQLVKGGMPWLTAYVIAGDIYSAEMATNMVADGMPPEEALHFVGSYARFDWAIKNLPRAVLFERLPELWIGADPDDTNPEYLALWHEAYEANGNRPIYDGKPFPRGKQVIYRGQVGDVPGISWTLEYAIAHKFAMTGGGRQGVEGGKVLRKVIVRKDILAYLTGRDESEVILKEIK